MMLSQSAIAMAPPFSLVSKFFVAACVLLLVSLNALPFVATQTPLLAFGAAGFIHLYLLGFVMMVILGALYQLVPVVLEAPFFTLKGSAVLFYAYLLGTLALSGGMVLGNNPLMHAGGTAVYGSLTAFAVLFLLSFKGVTRWNLVTYFLLASGVCLVLGISLGLALLIAMSTGGIGLDVMGTLIRHGVLSLGGFVMFVVMGVSLVLLPMFALAHGVSTWYSKVAFGAMLLAFGCAFADAFVPMAWLLALALVLYVAQSAHILAKRMRRKKDYWFYNVAFGLVCIVAAVGLGLWGFLGADENALKVAMFVFLVGFGLHFVAGHLYKILPFLVWYEFIAPLVGKQKVPMLHEMIQERYAYAQLLLGTLGTTLFALGMALHVRVIELGGAVLLALSGWALMVVLYRAYGFSTWKEKTC
jgi:hypothetical protein